MMKLFWNIKSVQSIHPGKSVIQTIYDIVKAHGGEIKVNTKENEGTQFTIPIPILTSQ
jgi:signal transduction histidine kinase